MKKEKSQWIPQKYIKKTHKRILWMIICQQIWQRRRNRQLSRELWPVKTESRRNRSTEQTDHRNEIEYVIKKHSLQTKVQDQMVSQANSTKHTNNLYPSFSTFSKRLKTKEDYQRHSLNDFKMATGRLGVNVVSIVLKYKYK